MPTSVLVNPLFSITQEVNLLLQQDSPVPEDFYRLLQLLEKHDATLSRQTKIELYTYLRNLCIILIDNGHLNYIEILHQIQKLNLSDGYLLIDGKIGPNTYSNLVQIAIRAKQIDWALEFTEKYKDLIIGQEDAPFFYRLNLASCLFASKKFNEALDSLPEVSPAPYYHLIARRLELKIYYEQNSDLLPYKIDSFRKYVERTAPKSVSSQNNDMNLSFANMLSQISQSPKKDRKRAERLEERINNKKIICERAWLLEKARELA